MNLLTDVSRPRLHRTISCLPGVFESFMKTRYQNAGEHITTSSPAGVPKFMTMFNISGESRPVAGQQMAR
jgi:hypothetical protein